VVIQLGAPATRLLCLPKVKVTLRLTVSQSVCLGFEPNLGLLTKDLFIYFFFLSKLLSCLFWAPSLTRGRVCQVSVFVIAVLLCLPAESSLLNPYRTHDPTPLIYRPLL
jgi:hypothetical protein